MDKIESEIRNLIKYHSELSSQKVQNQYIITGRFGFKTKIFDDEIVDAYKIEMRLGDKFRQQLPVVREIAGRVKRNIDNHINKDGTCWLGVPHQIKARLGANYTLLEFFDQVVTGYFAQYSYKEKHGKWPFGEASHCQVGLLEYYMESFGLQSFESVERFLEKLSELKNRPKGYQRCNCGCNKLIKNCPKQKLIKKAYIHGHDYISELKEVKAYLEKQYVSNKN